MPILRIRKPLKQRLTQRQLATRKDTMTERSTFRKEISTEHAKTRGAVNQSLQGLAVLAWRQRKLWYAVGGLTLTQIALGGKILGWW